MDGLKLSILMSQPSQLFGFSVPSGISFGKQRCFREFVHVNEVFNTQCTEAFLLLLNSQNIVYVIWILFEASFMYFLRIKSVTDTIRFVKIILFYCVYTYVCMGGTHICEQVRTHMNGGQRTTWGATPPLKQAWLSPIRLDSLSRESRKCCQHRDYKHIPLYSGDWTWSLCLQTMYYSNWVTPPESYVQIFYILHFYLINLTVVEKG